MQHQAQHQQTQKKSTETKVVCPYCVGEAQLVMGMKIYPNRRDLYQKYFYLCEPCKAYVGCHPGTKRALGRLANAELRVNKQAAHANFDPIWKTGKMTRSRAYMWLADRLGIKREDTHIGMFDVDTCKRVVNICRSFNADYVAGYISN